MNQWHKIETWKRRGQVDVSRDDKGRFVDWFGITIDSFTMGGKSVAVHSSSKIAQLKMERNEFMNTNIELVFFKVPHPQLNRVSFRVISHFMCANNTLPFIRSASAGNIPSVQHTINVRTF